MSRRFRDDAIGVVVLMLLVNVTFFPFLWGDASLRDSIVWPSVYGTGSRSPAAVHWPVQRELDPGAPSSDTEAWFPLEHQIIANERVAPLWNPYAAFGTPLAANMQSQPYSPFASIAIASQAPRAYNIFLAGRIFVAGLGAFFFLRLFVGAIPSLVGGAVFMYAGYFWLFLTMPEISVEAWLPSMLYGVERLVRRPTAGRIVFLAVLLAFAVFGGMPEALLLAVSTVTAYALARTFGENEVRSRIRAVLPALAAASILALGLSAVALLPFIEYVPRSLNYHSGTFVGLYADSSRRAFDFYLAPLMHGPALNNGDSMFPAGPSARGFFGCAAVFFALLAVASRFCDALRRRPSTFPILFFAALALFCLAKRFGLPEVNWLGGLPVFRLAIYPKYLEALLACSVAVLAGFGVAALLERRLSIAASALVATLPLCALTQAAGGSFAFAPVAGFGEEASRSYALLCALTFLGGGFAVALSTRFRSVRAPLAGVAALVLVVLEPHVNYIVPMFYVMDPPPPLAADTLAGAPYLTFLRAVHDGRRFLARDGILYPEWSSAFAVHDVRDNDALSERHYLPFLKAFLTPGVSPGEDVADRYTGVAPQDYGSARVQRFLQLGSIRYIGALGHGGIGGPNYRRVFASPEVSIYEFAHASARVSLYRRVVIAADDASALAILPSPTFDPSREAVVQGDATDPELAALGRAPRLGVIDGNLSVDRSREVEASVDAPSRGLVVLSDSMYPGWTASVDGRPAPILRANYLFRGVIVGPGKHVLRFLYEPVSYIVGRDLSICAAIVAVALLVFANGKKRAMTRKRDPRIASA